MAPSRASIVSPAKAAESLVDVRESLLQLRTEIADCQALRKRQHRGLVNLFDAVFKERAVQVPEGKARDAAFPACRVASLPSPARSLASTAVSPSVRAVLECGLGMGCAEAALEPAPQSPLRRIQRAREAAADSGSASETDEEMPELVPVPVERPSQECSLGTPPGQENDDWDVDSSDSENEASPAHKRQGGLDVCWGKHALKNALRSVHTGQDEGHDVILSEEGASDDCGRSTFEVSSCTESRPADDTST